LITYNFAYVKEFLKVLQKRKLHQMGILDGNLIFLFNN